MCLNYSPTLSTNLQSGNLITQRVKIKFHKQLEGLLSRNVLKILSGKVVFDETICHEEEGKWLPAKEKPLRGFAISVYLVLRYYPPAGARCTVHLQLPQLKRMTPKVFPKLQMMTVPLARTHYCVHGGTLSLSCTLTVASSKACPSKLYKGVAWLILPTLKTKTPQHMRTLQRAARDNIPVCNTHVGLEVSSLPSAVRENFSSEVGRKNGTHQIICTHT